MSRQIYLADVPLSSVLSFPQIFFFFFKGQVVFIARSFEEFFIKVGFYIGPEFPCSV